MKSKVRCIAAAGLLALTFNANGQNAPAFKATDRFFGVHFDFHANADTKGIGKTLRPEDVGYLLDQVKPDYIQVDTKGHPGVSSYPTTVGIAAPDIANDPLRIFRDETAKRGVGLFSHFSGILDAQAVKNHPDWARVNADGKPDGGAISIFGRYADDYFIPQINELSSKYHINGVWADGDCWALQPDFSPAAIAAYQTATGKANVPRSAKDADWAGFVQFTRQAFHNYLDKILKGVHRFNPKLLMTSNWSFTSFMPGKVDVPIDYLSGDVVNDATPNFEFEARVIARQDKPWDLMTWGFMGGADGKGHFWKSARQLEQKAAITLAQGGGYQIYINQNRDASLQMNTVPVLKELAQFCNARKAYSYQTKPVPQVALLLSAWGHYNESPGVFENEHGGNNNVKGTLAMLLNSQYSVDILQEHHLKGRLSKYPILVITEWRALPADLIATIETFVKNGGKVLAIGDSHLFNKMLPDKQIIASGLAVRKATYGKGTLICTADNISLKYLTNGNDTLRQQVAGLVQQLFPQPKVRVTGAPKLHVAVNTKGRSTLVHLINANDHYEKGTNNALNFLLPPVTTTMGVEIIHKSKPKAVKLQPGNVNVPFTYTRNKVNLQISGLDVYSILELVD